MPMRFIIENIRISVIVVLFACFLIGPAVNSSCQEQRPLEKRALPCLAPKNEDLLKFLKISHSGVLHYRIRRGGVPNSSDARITLPQLTAVFYSNDRKFAVITGAIISGDYVLLRDDSFLLRRRSKIWNVIHGSGGLGTYEEVARMLSSIDDLPFQETHASVSSPPYCIADSDWDVPNSKYLPIQK